TAEILTRKYIASVASENKKPMDPAMLSEYFRISKSAVKGIDLAFLNFISGKPVIKHRIRQIKDKVKREAGNDGYVGRFGISLGILPGKNFTGNLLTADYIANARLLILEAARKLPVAISHPEGQTPSRLFPSDSKGISRTEAAIFITALTALILAGLPLILHFGPGIVGFIKHSGLFVANGLGLGAVLSMRTMEISPSASLPLKKKGHNQELWYKKKMDASELIGTEVIRQNHTAIRQMAEEIEKATLGTITASRIRDFDIAEHLNAWKIFVRICKEGVSGPEDLEQALFEFQFYADESGNRTRDQWGGYFNNAALPEMKRLFTEIFAESSQEMIEKDPVVFAVKIFVDMVNAQPFYEVNHRAADFLMNFILAKHGRRIFLLTPDNIVEYYKLTNPSALRSESNFDEILAFFKREIEKAQKSTTSLPAASNSPVEKNFTPDLLNRLNRLNPAQIMSNVLGVVKWPPPLPLNPKDKESQLEQLEIRRKKVYDLLIKDTKGDRWKQAVQAVGEVYSVDFNHISLDDSASILKSNSDTKFDQLIEIGWEPVFANNLLWYLGLPAELVSSSDNSGEAQASSPAVREKIKTSGKDTQTVVTTKAASSPVEKKEPLASNSTIVSRLFTTATLTVAAFLLSAVNISREPENSPRQAPNHSVFLKGTLFEERETPLVISSMFSSRPELPRPLVPELVEFIKTHPINFESKQALNILNQNFVWEGRGTEVVSLDDVLGLCAPVFRILNVDEEMKIWLLNMFQRYMRQPGLSDKERVARVLLEYAPYLIDRGPTDKVRLQAVDALFALDENAGPEILSRLFDVSFGLLKDKSISHDIRLELEFVLRRVAYLFVMDMRQNHLERRLPDEEIFAKLSRVTGNDPVKLYVFFTDPWLYGTLADEIFKRLEAHASQAGTDLYAYLEGLDPLKHFFESFLFSAINFNKSDKWFNKEDTLIRSFRYLFDEIGQDSLTANAALTQVFIEKLLSEKGSPLSRRCEELLLDEYDRSANFHRFFIAATIVLHRGWFISLDDEAVDKIAEENAIDRSKFPSDRIDYSQILSRERRPVLSAKVVFVDKDASGYYGSAVKMFSSRGYRMIERKKDSVVLEKKGQVTMRVELSMKTDGTYRLGDEAVIDPNLKFIMIRGHNGIQGAVFSGSGVELNPGTHVVLSLCRGMFEASRYRFKYPGTLWVASKTSVLGHMANAVMVSMVEGLRTQKPTYSAIKADAIRLAAGAEDFVYPADPALVIGRLLQPATHSGGNSPVEKKEPPVVPSPQVLGSNSPAVGEKIKTSGNDQGIIQPGLLKVMGLAVVATMAAPFIVNPIPI
ncbi:MAG: hypothetical protein KKB22_07555, partial [Candidatus Omnitrophica bacterium]|nr:hypothetical protein [Candidatus Omnitrophota bacterium]